MRATIKQPSHLKKQRYQHQLESFQAILCEFVPRYRAHKTLVFGCGNGVEAAFMQQFLDTQVHGIDVVDTFEPWASQHVNLKTYNGGVLPYADNTFDLVYSYHVLEHVDDVETTVEELHRVLKPGGVLYAGTPNKARMVGYFGMRDKSFKQKMTANLRDWNKRLIGQWDNALGAHAGFRQAELETLLRPHFTQIRGVTADYYHHKWPHRRRTLKTLVSLGLQQLVLPSVYVIAKKPKGMMQ